MSNIANIAKEVAAKATGLRPDQIERAVEEYRKACAALNDEPEWKLLLHFRQDDERGIYRYVPQLGETKVILQIETSKLGDITSYLFDGKTFENYAEARSAELRVADVDGEKQP